MRQNSKSHKLCFLPAKGDKLSNNYSEITASKTGKGLDGGGTKLQRKCSSKPLMQNISYPKCPRNRPQ